MGIQTCHEVCCDCRMLRQQSIKLGSHALHDIRIPGTGFHLDEQRQVRRVVEIKSSACVGVIVWFFKKHTRTSAAECALDPDDGPPFHFFSSSSGVSSACACLANMSAT